MILTAFSKISPAARGLVLSSCASFVFVAVGCAPNVPSEMAARFQKAQQAFEQARTKEDFLRVAAMYEEFNRSGVVSGAVLYNQGNAFMRAGEHGRAIACYRRAKRYRPADPLLEANLQSALQATGHSSAPEPLIKYIFFWQDWISYPAKFRFATGLAVATFVLGVLGLYLRNGMLRVLAGVGLLVTLAMGGSASYDWYRFDYLEHGVVIRDSVTARKGNAATYEPAFTGSLTEGTEFRVIERRGDWLRIQLAQSQEGWVEAKDVVVF